MEETFAVVIAIGLAVFGMVFVLDSTGFDFSMEDDSPEKRLFIDRSYGQLGESNPDDRIIRFGDFSVGEARGDVTAYRDREAMISDRLLGGETLSFSYNATQPRTGSIEFEVLGRQGRGDLWVKVNGNRIFSESLIATGTPEIDVPRQDLNPGINRFEVGVSRNSLFGSSSYSIEDLEVKVNDRKFHDYTDSFQLFSYELQDYIESPLSFNVRSSVKTSPLDIYVNDNRIYSKEQVRSQNEVEVTPENADLHPGANSIRFETDRQAEYHLENAQLTMRYLGNVERQDIVFDFEMSRNQLDYAGRDDTDSRITFDYQNLLPSERPVRVELNDFNRTFVPDNGGNSLEIPDGTLEDENSFSFSTNGTYQINSLRILSEKGEE